MGKCSAPRCENSYRKGFVMVRFPKDEVIGEKWRIAVGGHITPSYNRLCKVHFEDDAWEKKPTLRPDSIPSLFCTCQENTGISQDSTRSAGSDHSYAGVQSVSLTSDPDKIARICKDFPESAETSTKELNKNLKRQIREMKNKLRKNKMLTEKQLETLAVMKHFRHLYESADYNVVVKSDR